MFNIAASADSVMPTAERHLQGMDHSEFMPTCKTVKCEPYCETSGNLKRGRRRFHPYMEQPVLQHDHVFPLTIARMNAEILAFNSASCIFCYLAPTSHLRIFISLPNLTFRGLMSYIYIYIYIYIWSTHS